MRMGRYVVDYARAERIEAERIRRAALCAGRAAYLAALAAAWPMPFPPSAGRVVRVGPDLEV